jgi:hypothetical protein
LYNTTTLQLGLILFSTPLRREFQFEKFPKGSKSNIDMIEDINETNQQADGLEEGATDLSSNPLTLNSVDMSKRKYAEFLLYKAFVHNLNMIFTKYGMPYSAKDTHNDKTQTNEYMPDITVRSVETLDIIFYVEIKKDINVDFKRNVNQAVDYAKDILEKNKERQFSICILLSPFEFTVFCAYIYEGEILTSQLVEKTKFNWHYNNVGFVKLLNLLSTDFNWYGSLFIPSPLPACDEKFSNNTFLTSHSVLNLNSSSHHFISTILFLLVLLYLYGMKLKYKSISYFNSHNSWKVYFSNIETSSDVEINLQPKGILKLIKERPWSEVLRMILSDILSGPRRWTSFIDSVCNCKDIYISWPKMIKKETYVSDFLMYCIVNEMDDFYKVFSTFPINALNTFGNTARLLDMPLLPSHKSLNIDLNHQTSFLDTLCVSILSSFQNSLFSLQFDEVFATPFKFFSFLERFRSWEEVFSKINLFSFNYLQLKKLERVKFLGSGLSGQVFEYRCLEKKNERYAVKYFYSDCDVEFKREIFAYLVVQDVVPTLKMVSYDLNQRILVLSPVASRTFRAYGRFPLELFQNLVDDLGKLHRLGLVHRDVRPDNLVYVPDETSIKLVLIDWSSSVYKDIETSFEGTVRYASDDVLQRLIRKKKITYTAKDDLCSMVKVFLGEILSVDKNLSNCLNEDISLLAMEVSNVWTRITQTYFWVKEFLQFAKTNNYEEVKRFMKGIYYGPSIDMVFV